MEPKDQVLEVWGEFACFTRPELKVERFSYPIITPSAARGIFDAIYCKPSRDGRSSQFRWQVTQVEVLAPPSYIALRRNEVKEKVSEPLVKRWMNGAEVEPLWADADESLTGTADKGRTQRQTMALTDVRYRLHARVHPWPGYEASVSALEAQFRRRAAHGKCFYQPYFGCREFPAFFELVEPSAPPARRAAYDADLGLMLYDVFDLSRPGTNLSSPHVSLFHARVVDGQMHVPPYESPEVLKAEGGSI
jgi:CRISPR-associated protein Cas5d